MDYSYLRGITMDEKYNFIIEAARNIVSPGSRSTLSSVIEDSIKDVLINKYGESWKENSDVFLESYESLRNNFMVDTYKADVPYLYSMYYMPINIPKIQLVLLQLMKRKRLNKELNILDVGSSVGTSAIAIIDLVVLLNEVCSLFGEEKLFTSINLNFMEGSSSNIKVFKENMSFFTLRMKKYSNIDYIKINEPIQCDITLEFNIKEKYDLIIFSNILNELQYETRRLLVSNCENKIKKNGNVIIIEPADSTNARALNQLKHDITKKGKFKCNLPCGVNDTCKDCWVFRSENIVKSELIDYIDNIYSTRYQSKYNNDYFYNNRLKWIYCILTLDDVIDNHSNLSEAKVGERISCNFNIISSRNKNTYKICDCSGNNDYSLNFENIAVNLFDFGDSIRAENVILNEQSNGEKVIIIDKDSIITNRYGRKINEKIKLEFINGEALIFILKRLWGFDDFREGQLPIIKSALLDKNTLGILPTGAGKSICFQLPAMLKPGVSIVVSPLKSLIKDQVTNLHRIGFEYVDYIDGSRSSEEKALILKRFKAGDLKLLYVAPERLQMLDFQRELIEMLKDLAIDYFIIDEAHCASEWGHDFRPSYLKLIDIVEKLNHPTVIAVTATASERVKKDIIEIFNLDPQNVISTKTLDRPEISLQVENVPIYESKDKYLNKVLKAKIPEILRSDDIEQVNNNGSGIVFTVYAEAKAENTRPYGTEHILDRVREVNIPSELYHSKLDDDTRGRIQDEFKEDKFPVLVSTKGFGMGIDKPNIRYIVHMCYSGSLEAYYQEAGRAGRDGEHAHSVIIARSRHPKCLESSSNLGNNEPVCVKGWKCKFTNGIRCDYGMQAKFISDHYKDAFTTKRELEVFLDKLESCSNGLKKFRLFCSENQTAKDQTFLYYLQKENIVEDYVTLQYRNGGMEFQVLLHEGINWNNLVAAINNIVSKLQEFKKQKYNMLESMWEYVDNTNMCRRQFLMQYFGDEVSYGEKGCGFCDIEGFSEEKAESVTSSLRVNNIYNIINSILSEKIFNYGKISNLLVESYKENISENIKIRMMRYLEDYPDNVTALYLSGIITFRREPSEYYGRNQLYSCIELLVNKKSTNDIYPILHEIADFEENLVLDTIERQANILEDGDRVKGLYNKLSKKASKEYLYKLHMDYKVSKLKDMLQRRRR